ncbi:MAG: aldehyde-activating protein [Proteobacteria bacterium]|nr:aldehyde-activating protein [Pseudomonadota bacterium]
MIQARCHCRNIILEVETLPDTVTECNCSICRRLAVRWIYYKNSEVKVINNKAQSNAYQWCDKVIEFHCCPICGCTTHYQSTSLSELDRIAINSNMLKPELLKNLKIRRFNGAKM